uniref:MIR domain-containing protein n=1 Tax=Colobus angolensis palliatus TaxID=336983 RepID=A0A2K5ISS0_COLAP
MAVVPLLLFGGLWSTVRTSNLAVTCGSMVKLLKMRYNVQLHSHDVLYGSGSGQQSVTGVTSMNESNSYWRIRGKITTAGEKETPIKCCQPIRLTHVNTVSAFGEEGEGSHLDDWTILCNGPHWVRDGEGEQYGGPISGQKEMHGQNNSWKAMEGIFMRPSELLKAEGHHTELGVWRL